MTLAAVLAATGAGVGGGCARAQVTRGAGQQPTATAAAATQRAGERQEQPMAWMVNESELPKGFPGPGPVGQVMEKQYPASRVAEVRAAELGGAAGMNGMFRPLFNHIKSNQISMTSPVVMELSGREPGRAESMAFVYGDPGIGTPGEAAGKVHVEDAPPLTVLSVALRGGYGERQFRRGEERLRAWLAEHPGRYEVVGPARVLAYNSPFVPWFLKLSEVQVPVRAAGGGGRS